MMKKLLVFFLVGSLWMVSDGIAKTLKETIKHTFKVSPGTRLVLKNTNGTVTLEGWDRPEVHVEATKIARGSRTKYLKRGFEKLRIHMRKEGNELIIDTIFPNRGFSLWDLFRGSSYHLRVDYHIKVPRDMLVHVKATNGNIKATRISGNVLLRTTNGNITVSNCQGLIKARTTNGNITLNLNQIQPEGEYEIKTTNGNIAIQLPDEAEFEIHAHTTNGSVMSDFPLRIKEKWNSQSVDGMVGQAGPVFLVETTNGNILIQAGVPHAVLMENTFQWQDNWINESSPLRLE